MSLELPKGFRYLNVSQYSTIGLIALPLMVSVLNLKPYFLFAWDPFVSRWNQYWRLLILQFQFQNQSEVAISSILVILYLKGLERSFGSLKTVKIIILLWCYNLLMITITSFVLYHFGIDLFVPSGPFGIIFGLYYPYERFLPKTYEVAIDFRSLTNYKPFGEDIIFTINDKFPAQLMFLMLLLSEGVSSIVPSMLGYVIGFLYFNGLVPITDESMGLIDKVANLFRHKKVVRITNVITATTSQSVADEDDDNELNNSNREDTAVPPRTIGQQMMDTFT